jgi:hypothetical protein
MDERDTHKGEEHRKGDTECHTGTEAVSESVKLDLQLCRHSDDHFFRCGCMSTPRRFEDLDDRENEIFIPLR